MVVWLEIASNKISIFSFLSFLFLTFIPLLVSCSFLAFLTFPLLVSLPFLVLPSFALPSTSFLLSLPCLPFLYLSFLGFFPISLCFPIYPSILLPFLPFCCLVSPPLLFPSHSLIMPCLCLLKSHLASSCFLYLPYHNLYFVCLAHCILPSPTIPLLSHSYPVYTALGVSSQQFTALNAIVGKENVADQCRQ